MKITLPAILALTATATAGEPAKAITPATPQPFALIEGGYSFDAGYDRAGHGSAIEWRTRAGVLTPLGVLPQTAGGEWKLRLGVDWHRFEFDHTGPLPLPSHLQSVSAIIGLELHVSGQIGALLDVRPGVYFEDDAGGNAWNFPVRLGFGWRVSDRFSLAVMGRYNGFAKNPFIGGAGFIWKISDTVTLSAMAPEPRITWQASERLALWAGGEFAGGAYRTSQFGEAVVDYTDYRAFIGATWTAGNWTLEAAAGASIEREWDYHRADKRYETDEASPFLKISASAKW